MVGVVFEASGRDGVLCFQYHFRFCFGAVTDFHRGGEELPDKIQRGVAEFSISLARGRADLFPEMPVAVSGFKSVIDAQPWIISKVAHSLGSSGFVTALNLEVLLSDVSYEATDDIEVKQ